MLAVGNCLQYQVFRNAIAPDQLDHDVDVRMINHQIPIADNLALPVSQLLGARGVQVSHHRNLNLAAGAPGNFLLIALQYIECAGPDGADA
jgi:hypothetical protein